MHLASEPAAVSARLSAAALRSVPGAGVLVFDRELSILMAGGEALAAVGLEGELEGRTGPQALPRARWRVLEPLWHAALDGETSSTELPSADGSSWIAVEVGPLRDESLGAADVLGGVLVARDVTEARRAEQEMRTGRDRLWAVLDGLEVVITVKDRQQRYLMVNRAYERELGVRREDLLGRTASEVFSPQIAADYEQDDTAVIETGGVVRSERPGVHADGTMHIYHMVRSPLKAGGTDEICGVIAAGTDLTELRRAQHALEEAEELFEQSFDNALIGMALTAPDGRWLRVNEAFASMLGYRVEHLKDRSWHEITHPDDLAHDREEVRRLLAGEISAFIHEKRYVHARGHAIWAEVACRLVRHPNGAPRHIVVQIRDVTERHLLEQRLRHEADHDPLTGALNRRRFEDELTAQIERCRFRGESAALLMLDVDGLKQINDEHGHAAGDEALLRTAAALRGRLREPDVVGRLGGDEFAVLISGIAAQDADHLAGELAELVESHSPLSCGVPLRVSVGAVPIGQRTRDDDEALLAADRAMYRVKRSRTSSG
jgi:diguanylate cyclase (GGDEF)-like protein/PAS domain S-box-containing protein